MMESHESNEPIITNRNDEMYIQICFCYFVFGDFFFVEPFAWNINQFKQMTPFAE